MDKPVPSDVTLRAPRPDEAERIRHLFRHVPLPQPAQILAAVRSRPVERFVAAIACWPEGNIVRFRLACQPGVPRSDLAQQLIQRVEESSGRSGAAALHYGESLADDGEWLPVLRQCGFEPVHSERFFEVPAVEARIRVMELFEKYQAAMPASWRTESIRHHPPEPALEVIGEHRLMPADELRARWREDSPAGFELDWSCFLFDEARAVGVLLARRVQDALCIDVRVVRIGHPRRRALGNACLLHHLASRCDPPRDAVPWLRFRAGEIEHRETANLAFRMQGRELPMRHILGKKL